MSEISSNSRWQPSPQSEWIVGLGCALLLLLASLIFFAPESVTSPEGFYRVRVARDLIEGASRGRQGLVGSLTMAPLPTIIVSLVSVALYVTPALWLTCVIAAFCTCVLCVYMNRLWCFEGVSPVVRYPSVLALACIPSVVGDVATGGTMMLFVSFAVMGMGFLLHWLDRLVLRDLAYAALFIGAGVVIRYQGIYIFLGSLCIVLVAIAIKGRRKGMFEGTAVAFVTPAVYAALLWIGGNWLILGDPIFFLRGVMQNLVEDSNVYSMLLATSCNWALMGCVSILVLCPTLGRFSFQTRRGGVWVQTVAVSSLFLAMLWATSLNPMDRGEEKQHDIHQTVMHLETQYPNGSFIVTGYEGYEFKKVAGRDPERAWIHMMHVEESKVNKTLDDFQGRRLFVLVKATEGVDKWQRLGLEWKRRKTRIPDRFMYVETLGPWVVFEALREAG